MHHHEQDDYDDEYSEQSGCNPSHSSELYRTICLNSLRMNHPEMNVRASCVLSFPPTRPPSVNVCIDWLTENSLSKGLTVTLVLS